MTNDTRLIRILSVDDHPLLRSGIAALIDTQPDMRMVGEASNGNEAVQLHRQLNPDVTLMDLQMPGMSGLDAMISIRTEQPSARIIVLTTYAGDVLAQRARSLKGTAQRINLGADIFLADETGRYIGRVCHYRECHPRMSCEARHCGRHQHLNDDLDVITLVPTVIAEPPVDLHPRIVRRCAVPADVDSLLLVPLAEGSSP